MASKSKRLSTPVVVERVCALLDGVDPKLGSLTSADALALVTAAHSMAGRALALAARAAAHAEATAAADFETGAPLASWLTASTRLTRHEAKKLIRQGRDLVAFPDLSKATDSGEVLYEQATVIGGVLRKLPNDLSSQQISDAEATMIGFAREHDSFELARLAGHLLEVIDPEFAEQREAKAIDRQLRSARASRTLGFYPDGNGSVLIRGQLPSLAAEPLIKLVDAYAQQQRRTDAELADPDAEYVTNGMRRADALCALVAQHQQRALAPSCGGDRPRIVVTMHYDTLLEACVAAGVLDPGGKRSDPTGTSPASDSGARPAREHSSRTSGAVVQGKLLASGTQISPGDLRRLACDAEILPMILGGDSEILDVGRSQRLVTPAIRVALTLRDKGCVFPGCHGPAAACHAHHLTPWWAGGSTSIENLALVCPHHHGLVEPARDGPPGTRKASRRWRIEIRTASPKLSCPTTSSISTGGESRGRSPGS